MIPPSPDPSPLEAELRRIAGVSELDIDPEALRRYAEELAEAVAALGLEQTLLTPESAAPVAAEAI